MRYNNNVKKTKGEKTMSRFVRTLKLNAPTATKPLGTALGRGFAYEKEISAIRNGC